MAGYTYDSYQQAVITQIPTVLTDPNFQTMLPNSIDYSELSIYRDVDFLSAHGNVTLGNATIGTATQTIPSSVVGLEELYFGASNTPVSPMSQAAIRAIYSSTPSGPPQYFAVIGAAAGSDWTPGLTVLLGPAPDQTYPLTGYGWQREATLSATHPTTFISVNLPDLFWSCAMIFWSSYLKNFGAASDQPQMAVSWEQEYQRLLKGAQVEEARKRFASQGWQAQSPAPLAAQPRV